MDGLSLDHNLWFKINKYWCISHKIPLHEPKKLETWLPMFDLTLQSVISPRPKLHWDALITLIPETLSYRSCVGFVHWLSCRSNSQVCTERVSSRTEWCSEAWPLCMALSWCQSSSASLFCLWLVMQPGTKRLAPNNDMIGCKEPT